jgi:hypothetical protein
MESIMPSKAMADQLARADHLGVEVPDDVRRWGADHVRGWLDAEERMRAAKARGEWRPN